MTTVTDFFIHVLRYVVFYLNLQVLILRFSRGIVYLGWVDVGVTTPANSRAASKGFRLSPLRSTRTQQALSPLGSCHTVAPTPRSPAYNYRWSSYPCGRRTPQDNRLILGGTTPVLLCRACLLLLEPIHAVSVAVAAAR